MAIHLKNALKSENIKESISLFTLVGTISFFMLIFAPYFILKWNLLYFGLSALAGIFGLIILLYLKSITEEKW